MRRFTAVTLLLFVAATACLGAQKSSRAKAEDDIREAVFRYQFTHNCWGRPEKVYFLSVNDKDPSKAFMRRFRGHKPPVKPVSKCRIDKNLVPGRPKTAVIDRETGDRGLIFKTEKIKWLNATKVAVEGGYYADGRGASGNTYTVEMKKGRWVVTKDDMKWIS